MKKINMFSILVIMCLSPLAAAADSHAPLLQKLKAEEQKILEMYEDCRRKQDRMNKHRLQNPGEGVDALPIDIFQEQDLACKGFLSVLERNRQAQQILNNPSN